MERIFFIFIYLFFSVSIPSLDYFEKILTFSFSLRLILFDGNSSGERSKDCLDMHIGDKENETIL